MNGCYRSAQVKKHILRALAQQDPAYAAFEADWKDVLPKTECPGELAEAVLELAARDPAVAAMADDYAENMEGAGTYAVPGLPEIGVFIAVLFLLRTHIKIRRNTDGKWEFLLEHKEMAQEPIEKIAEMLMKLFSSPAGKP